VGKLQGDNYPVSFSSSGTLQKNDKDAERIKKIEERLPREKLLSNYVLLVPKSKLEDTLKKRAEMLEKKDDAKKSRPDHAAAGRVVMDCTVDRPDSLLLPEYGGGNSWCSGNWPRPRPCSRPPRRRPRSTRSSKGTSTMYLHQQSRLELRPPQAGARLVRPACSCEGQARLTPAFASTPRC
jgi:hypothetical protein